MIPIEILIPIADNDGVAFDRAHVEAFEAAATEAFNGVSRLPGTVEGAWVEGGKVYRDSSWVYRVAIASITQGGQLGELIELAKRHFRQEAIYLSYLGVAEII